VGEIHTHTHTHTHTHRTHTQDSQSPFSGIYQEGMITSIPRLTWWDLVPQKTDSDSTLPLFTPPQKKRISVHVISGVKFAMTYFFPLEII